MRNYGNGYKPDRKRSARKLSYLHSFLVFSVLLQNAGMSLILYISRFPGIVHEGKPD
jgi:hypothetical protein